MLFVAGIHVRYLADDLAYVNSASADCYCKLLICHFPKGVRGILQSTWTDECRSLIKPKHVSVDVVNPLHVFVGFVNVLHLWRFCYYRSFVNLWAGLVASLFALKVRKTTQGRPRSIRSISYAHLEWVAGGGPLTP